MKIDMIKENEERKILQEVRESLEKIQGLGKRRTRIINRDWNKYAH